MSVWNLLELSKMNLMNEEIIYHHKNGIVCVIQRNKDEKK